MSVDQQKPVYRRWWFWLLAGLFMFLLGYLVGRSLTEPGAPNAVESLL